ncbi:hypothetical protein PR202_ga16922 [Eleusine coracana subsp. coracana]|uniref:MATH domain-containing protein n=1 Tax=Eleusine coracana subsp. coracana TaxID=191504 RepID=A0AAV5CMN5_ELECO|nr:hypothetical protein PR202_ga16922 [Eleusine coracana subsp. coracana]
MSPATHFTKGTANSTINSEGQASAPAESPICSSEMSKFPDMTYHASTSTNCNAKESFSQEEKRRDIQGSDHLCEAIQNIPSFDFVWTIEGGLFLVPWYRWGRENYLTLTLYLEDEPSNVEEPVVGVFARRLACKWESIELISLEVFLDPSYGFLIDDTCVFGVEILHVVPTPRQPLLASDSSERFKWVIRRLSAEQEEKPYIYKEFSACGYDWIVFVLIGRPHSFGSECLQVYLSLSASSHTFRQLFGRFKFRLVNQLTGNHIDKSYYSLFHSGRLHGCASVVPLRAFYDEAEGFLVQDCCIVEVEVSVLSQKPPQRVINYYHGYAAAVDENVYHNPFAWDMSPYWSFFRQDPEINAFAGRDGKWGFNDFIASDVFMDASNGFVVDGICELGVKLLTVRLFRVKRESLMVQHMHVNHDHTWVVRNFSTIEHQCLRREEFEAAGCHWSIYLQRINFKHYYCFHDDVVLFLGLDSTSQKKSLTVSYQFHVKGLAGGYEFCDAYTNVFVPGQCHGHYLKLPLDVYRLGWSFEEDTCIVRVRLAFLGYVEANSNGTRDSVAR